MKFGLMFLSPIILLLFISCCEPVTFAEEIGALGVIQGRVVSIDNEGTYGIEGEVYPFMERDCYTEMKKYRLTKQSDVESLMGYFERSEEVSFIFQVNTITNGEWGIGIHIVSF